MNVDNEKFNFSDKVFNVTDGYGQDDNALIDIPEDKIYMELVIDNQNYIAFTENSDNDEEIEIMFAKVDFINGNEIVRSINNADEYENVIKEFNKRLEIMLELEGNND